MKVNHLKRRDFITLLGGAVAGWPFAARAQTYPSRPTTMIVPFAAGGSFDVIGRILAARMSEILDQQVIVENTSGAAGIIGVNRIVHAAPDGYTFLLGSIGTHAYNQTIYKKPRYDAIADFTPVSLFAEQPMVLTTRKDFPADNQRDKVGSDCRIKKATANHVPNYVESRSHAPASRFSPMNGIGV